MGQLNRTAPTGLDGIGQGFNPLNYGSPEHAYWAEDPDWSHPADGATITSWRDAGAQGADAVNGTMPQYRANGIGGRPAVYFDGTTRCAAVSSTAIPLPGTVVAVWQFDNADATPSHVLDGLHGRWVLYRGATGAFLVWASGSHSSANLGTTPRLVVGSMVADGIRVRHNGVEFVGTGASGSFRTPCIGARQNNTANMIGHIALVMIYPSDITTEPWFPEMEQRLMQHYGISS